MTDSWARRRPSERINVSSRCSRAPPGLARTERLVGTQAAELGASSGQSFRASEKGPQIMSAEMIRHQNIPARFHIELQKLTTEVE